ncbi:hypothetical protein COB52_02750 [Candidatus Kaiserbacteria bacterium]|nr:MAG: hypothetical protein COB52_02750 [Candidatus Kaiserbacteria bacterium]
MTQKIFSTVLLWIILSGIARSEVIIYVDTRIIECMRIRIPALISGEYEPDKNVDLEFIANSIMRRNWEATAFKNAPEVKSSLVLREFTGAIKELINTSGMSIRGELKDAKGSFTKEPKLLRPDTFLIEGLFKIESGEYAGKHAFKSRITIKDNTCLIQTLRLTMNFLILKTDLFSLKSWLESKDEIQDLLKKYGLS